MPGSSAVLFLGNNDDLVARTAHAPFRNSLPNLDPLSSERIPRGI